MMKMSYTYLEPMQALCFAPQKKVFPNQNQGHLASRYSKFGRMWFFWKNSGIPSKLLKS